MKTLAQIIAVILVIDITGLLAWKISGQTPIDNIYLGSITAHLIEVIK